MDRRDLLKLFGVGSLVVPAAAKFDLEPTVARILEPPKLEVVPAAALQSLNQASMLSDVPFGEMRGTLHLETETQEYTLHVHCFHFHTAVDTVDITSHSNWPIRKLGTTQVRMSFDIIASPKIQSRKKTT